MLYTWILSMQQTQKWSKFINNIFFGPKKRILLCQKITRKKYEKEQNKNPQKIVTCLSSQRKDRNKNEWKGDQRQNRRNIRSGR